MFYSSGTNDPLALTPRYMSQRVVDANDVELAYAINEFGHQGLYHDEELGLVYNRARMLHPRFGRFMQRDLLVYTDGMNLYAYERTNPIISTDNTGLATYVTRLPEFSVSRVVDDFPPYTGGTYPLGPDNLGATVTRYDVEIECEEGCDGFWRVVEDGVKVSSWSQIYLKPKSKYESMHQWQSTLRAEHDHVQDHIQWVIDDGRDWVDKMEGYARNRTFLTKSDCEEKARNQILQGLHNPIRNAEGDSYDKWDYSGKHNYGGPNARPLHDDDWPDWPYLLNFLIP